MENELRKIILASLVSLVSIRLWIEVVTTTILKNSAIISSINNNKIGYHHYQLGVVVTIFALLALNFMPKWQNQAYLTLGFGLALFFDQYTYVLSAFGINLPFGYRSRVDYLIVAILLMLLVAAWLYFGKKT